ncbi:ankyrin repeat domain-containing protein [Candidatus Dependentiae bacterium]|nr:ankyrin repeat domain-containing protein [Candidatus Dependentiae bacterium]
MIQFLKISALTLLTHSLVAMDYERQLITGILAGDLQLVQEALDNGATGDGGAMPALHAAAGLGKDAIIELLIDRGSKTNLENTHWPSPLLQAVFGGHVSTVKLLLKLSLDDRLPFTGDTPLHLAAQTGDSNMLSALLQLGFKPNVLNRYFVTPLEIAVRNNQAEAVDILLAAGASPCFYPELKQGKDALQYAQQQEANLRLYSLNECSLRKNKQIQQSLKRFLSLKTH